jgi:hypothetical protein
VVSTRWSTNEIPSQRRRWRWVRRRRLVLVEFVERLGFGLVLVE